MWSNQNRGYMKKGNSERGEVTCSNVSRLSMGKPRFYPQFVNRPTLLSADTAMLSVCKQAPAKRVRSTAFQSLLLSHPLSPLPSSPPLPARREGSSRAVLQNSAPASRLWNCPRHSRPDPCAIVCGGGVCFEGQVLMSCSPTVPQEVSRVSQPLFLSRAHGPTVCFSRTEVASLPLALEARMAWSPPLRDLARFRSHSRYLLPVDAVSPRPDLPVEG